MGNEFIDIAPFSLGRGGSVKPGISVIIDCNRSPAAEGCGSIPGARTKRKLPKFAAKKTV